MRGKNDSLRVVTRRQRIAMPNAHSSREVLNTSKVRHTAENTHMGRGGGEETPACHVFSNTIVTELKYAACCSISSEYTHHARRSDALDDIIKGWHSKKKTRTRQSHRAMLCHR